MEKDTTDQQEIKKSEKEKDEDDIEIFQITFKKKKYYVCQQNNDVYDILSDGDIGKKIGTFSSSIKNGKKRNKIIFD